ncbi:hypothetical protein Misp01_40100 [Microtetraspora sp. NBRC 13810]|uniref:HGxxPAAW family protein n=1 Tax=Microtetraspora sp. NBRC 13810 TaxID=3030990 RepID=UPI002555A9A0|nr:HGxxPAAW family protein [Microtetraspora sp. NBRC 13810]GLW08880.1 hypothetical protein Misp01_40100 [Microtetraspora sp. NBRC 13810]
MTDSRNIGNHGGNPKSWLAVITILIGFTIGGVAFTMGPNWALIWTGVGLCAVGGVLALVFDIFSDVIIEAPRVMTPQALPVAAEKVAD